MMMTTSDGNSSIIFYNIHDYLLYDNPKYLDALEALKEDLTAASIAPLHFVVFVAGDFIRSRAQDTRQYIDPVQHAHYLQSLSSHSSNINKITLPGIMFWPI